jgi:hypothetical protein
MISRAERIEEFAWRCVFLALACGTLGALVLDALHREHPDRGSPAVSAGEPGSPPEEARPREPGRRERPPLRRKLVGPIGAVPDSPGMMEPGDEISVDSPFGRIELWSKVRVTPPGGTTFVQDPESEHAPEPATLITEWSGFVHADDAIRLMQRRSILDE